MGETTCLSLEERPSLDQMPSLPRTRNPQPWFFKAIPSFLPLKAIPCFFPLKSVLSPFKENFRAFSL